MCTHIFKLKVVHVLGSLKLICYNFFFRWCSRCENSNFSALKNQSWAKKSSGDGQGLELSSPWPILVLFKDWLICLMKKLEKRISNFRFKSYASQLSKNSNKQTMQTADLAHFKMLIWCSYYVLEVLSVP